MAYIPLEKMIEHNPSRYKLVLVAAERANQIGDGSKPMLESPSKKATTIALEEICEGKVKYQMAKEKKSKT